MYSNQLLEIRIHHKRQQTALKETYLWWPLHCESETTVDNIFLWSTSDFLLERDRWNDRNLTCFAEFSFQRFLYRFCNQKVVWSKMSSKQNSNTYGEGGSWSPFRIWKLIYHKIHGWCSSTIRRMRLSHHQHSYRDLEWPWRSSWGGSRRQLGSEDHWLLQQLPKNRHNRKSMHFKNKLEN